MNWTAQVNGRFPTRSIYVPLQCMNESAALLACLRQPIAGSACREAIMLRAVCKASAGPDCPARLRPFGPFEPLAPREVGGRNAKRPGFSPGVRVTKFAGPVSHHPPVDARESNPSFPGPPFRADAGTPLPWRVSGAADGRDPSKPLRQFIPLMEALTKRLRGAAWILKPLCGYRATNSRGTPHGRG